MKYIEAHTIKKMCYSFRNMKINTDSNAGCVFYV